MSRGKLVGYVFGHTFSYSFQVVEITDEGFTFGICIVFCRISEPEDWQGPDLRRARSFLLCWTISLLRFEGSAGNKKTRNGLVTLKELLRGDSPSPRLFNLELVSGSSCESDTAELVTARRLVRQFV